MGSNNCLEILKNYNLTTQKVSENRYFIDSNIIFNGSALPVYLVELGQEVYFADYAQLLKTYHITKEQKFLMGNICKKYGVEFNDFSFLLKVKDNVYKSYSDFLKVLVACLVIVE